MDRLTGDDLPGWLATQAKTYALTYLLAHADDGVIWGRWSEAEGLVTSHEAAQGTAVISVCPPLRVVTLLQARLFASHAEMLLWRDGHGKLLARLIADSPFNEATWTESFDEPQRLLGTHALPFASGFSLLEDGAQGLRHVVPLSPLPDRIDIHNPPCLRVRHYLAPEPLARVAASRLASFEFSSSAVPSIPR